MIKKGDNMLKNTRERLIDELNHFNAKLKETKTQYEKLTKEYNTGKELINASHAQKNASTALFGGMLPTGSTLLIGGGFTIAYWAFIGPIILAGEGILALFFARIIFKNIKNYKKANKRLETAQANVTTSYNLYDDLDMLENDLEIRVDYLMNKCLKEIQRYEENIRRLWSVLANNNLLGLLEIKEEGADLSSILEAEWEDYLEEIKNMPVSNLHLTTDGLTEECYKESTQKLHVEPKKLENKPSNPLSLY